MSNRLKVILLYGGKSGEHEISLRSACSVLTNLDAEKYQIIPVAMDKEGCFYLNDYEELLACETSLAVKTEKSRPLDSLLKNGGLAIDADVIFPMVHGPLYEDGCLQGLLALTGAAYVGSDVLASAIGMDKDVARRLVASKGISSARYKSLTWQNYSPEEIKEFCQQTAEEFGWPLFVKPCSMGSSVGIHKVNDLASLLTAVDDARRYDETVLIEEFIQGREIELAVLENSSVVGTPKVTVPGEICVNHSDGFYSYTAKYLESNQTDLFIPAQLSEEITNQLQQAAVDIFTCLKCKGMARIDFFVNDQSGKIYFNEINTLPGFTSISMYPKLWQASGLTYPELLDQLISAAMMHHRIREQLVTHYQ